MRSPPLTVSATSRRSTNLEVLRDTAAASGCTLGCYFSLCESANETFRTPYIHSKLMIVDDRFLTVGSANLTNRSLALDSELHVAWEHEGDSGGLVESIRNVRVSLLAEHAGLSPATRPGSRPSSSLAWSRATSRGLDPSDWRFIA